MWGAGEATLDAVDEALGDTGGSTLSSSSGSEGNEACKEVEGDPKWVVEEEEGTLA